MSDEELRGNFSWAKTEAEYVVGGLRESRCFARKQKNIAPLARTIELKFGGNQLVKSS